MTIRKAPNKILQRKIYDFISRKYYLCILVLVIAISVALIHFFEIYIYLTLKSSSKPVWCPKTLPKYGCPAFFCEPIDAVYTWVNGSDPVFTENIHKYSTNANYDRETSRFDDKYELLYSLRSLEKYMPWVRKVYIVTNGQIPHWLDLDYPRVSVVTHEELVREELDGLVSDILPTFSSPAIETFIHRIPGLSERFIYLNDDIIMGSPVLPTDWCWGDKRRVPTAWSVPNCSPECPWPYIGDGSCDTQCNIADCQYDGGDCDPESSHKKQPNSRHTKEDEYEEDEEENELESNKNSNFKQANFKEMYRKQYEDLAVLQKVIANEAEIAKEQNTALEITNKSNRRSLLWEGVDKSNVTTLLDVLTKNITNVSRTVENHNDRVLQRYKSIKRRKTNRKKRIDAPNLRILDMYAKSLIHTNRILNERYGFEVRRVPAHMPFLLEKSVMEDFQTKYAQEVRATRRNRFRRPNDLQFSFSYYHFLVNEKEEIAIEDIFDIFDTDLSGTWSDREIRTILVRMYETPLQWETIKYLEDLAINCSKSLQHIIGDIPEIEQERYADSKMPTVTKALIMHCIPIQDLLRAAFGQRSVYGAKIVPTKIDQIAVFMQLTSNISNVITALDKLRKPTKFICINDNLDSRYPEVNQLVVAHLSDFYEALFPIPSKFELPPQFVNRFRHMHQVKKYKADSLKLLLYIIVLALAVLVICYYKFFRILKRKFRH